MRVKKEANGEPASGEPTIVPGRVATVRVFVVGSRGQLGHELMRAAWPAGTALVGADLPELDLTQPDAIARAVRGHAADIVVNAAAYTAVDKAESERDLAFRVNADGPHTLAKLGLPLVHVSTDYVFDGQKQGPYVEDDPIAPLGVYGASKAAGERAVADTLPRHLILRTSWVYAAHGANFVRTMIRLSKERDVLSVVADQHGRPTSARELARTIVALAPRMVARDFDRWGTYHFAGAGETTWHGLASEVIARAAPYTGKTPEIRAIRTEDYPTPAKRPANSILDTHKFERAFGLPLMPWQASVAEVVGELLGEKEIP